MIKEKNPLLEEDISLINDSFEEDKRSFSFFRDIPLIAIGAFVLTAYVAVTSIKKKSK